MLWVWLYCLFRLLCERKTALIPMKRHHRQRKLVIRKTPSRLIRARPISTSKIAAGPDLPGISEIPSVARQVDPKWLTFQPDGSLTLTWGSIWTAAVNNSSATWTGGVAFGGGGYFEAELKFDPEDTLLGKTPWWPSFWSIAVEHLARLKDEQWPGMPSGYIHYAEVDFFEFAKGWWAPPKCCYAGTINDWYGIWKQTCKEGFCVRNNNLSGKTKFRNFRISYPSQIDFNAYHRYGLLWVPATETKPGYAQYFFDGKPTSDRVFWSKYSDQPAPPGDTPWTFGILDKQHLVITLGTGKDKPLTIRAFNVWQSSNNKNWVR